MSDDCKVIGCTGQVLWASNKYRKYTLGYCRLHWSEMTTRKRAAVRPVEIGEKYTISTGYVLVRTADGVIPEHRLVMERLLGRALRKGESVHHKNGKRGDNSPENLELWVSPIRYGQRADEVRCPHCDKPWLAPVAPEAAGATIALEGMP